MFCIFVFCFDFVSFVLPVNFVLIRFVFHLFLSYAVLYLVHRRESKILLFILYRVLFVSSGPSAPNTPNPLFVQSQYVSSCIICSQEQPKLTLKKFLFFYTFPCFCVFSSSKIFRFERSCLIITQRHAFFIRLSYDGFLGVFEKSISKNMTCRNCIMPAGQMIHSASILSRTVWRPHRPVPDCVRRRWPWHSCGYGPGWPRHIHSPFPYGPWWPWYAAVDTASSKEPGPV